MEGNSPLPPARLVRAAPRLRSAVQRTAFWSGALLPLTYVPLLVLIDVGLVEGLGPLLTLVVANATALLLGYGHEPGR